MPKYSFLLNAIWSFLSQSGAILIALLANLILARLISPEEFGRIGVLMFFITLMTSFSESGLGGALVRKQNVGEKDYSTVFLFNLVFGVILYLALFFTSDFIADFYNDKTLSLLIKVGGLMIVINSFSIINNAKIYISMAFRLNMKVNLISSILGSMIGVSLAFSGFGVWSLIYMSIFTLLVRTIWLIAYFGGIRVLKFDLEIFKKLFSYGFFTTLISFLGTSLENIYQLVFAKYFNLSQSGHFYQAKKIQSSPFSVFNTIILGVIFAQLAKLQDNIDKFYSFYISVFRVFCFIITLMTSVFVLCGEEIVLILIGEKWIESVIYFKVLSVSGLFILLKVFVQNVLKIYNMPNRLFRYEIIPYILQIAFIIYGAINKDIVFLLFGLVTSSIISYLICTFYTWKTLKRSSANECFTLSKIIFLSILALYIVGKVTSNLNLTLSSSLFIKSFTFLILYGGGIYLTKTVSINDLRSLKN